MYKPLLSLIAFLCTASPALLYANLYLPTDGASPPTSVLEEFVAPKKWDSSFSGVPATVSYSFVTVPGLTYDETAAVGGGMGTLTPLASFMPAGALDEIRDAFDAWSAVANITFNEVPDSDNDYNSAGDADIRIAGHGFGGVGGTLAHAFVSAFDTSPLDLIDVAWIDFDVAENWKINSIRDVDGTDTIDIFQVAAHEIGHAIGLGHELTNVALMNEFYSEAFTGPQADDIAGAQFLYSAIPEPSAFLFGGLVCSVLGANYARKRKSSVS